MNNSALDLIGNTPLLRLRGVENELGLGFSLFGKVEYLNPSGSIKDRAAGSILLSAMERKELKKGDTVVDASSGNMGISLAMLGALMGLKVRICIPSDASKERALLISSYGAKVDLIKGTISDAIDTAKSLALKYGYYYPDQFHNPDNPRAHYKSTAPEIYKSSCGQVDYIICGVGTCGTLKGISDYFRCISQKTKIVAVEPEESAVLSGKQAKKHGIQGIGAGFIPCFFNTGLINSIITVSYSEAVYYSRLIAKADGIAVGFSSGAALAAALKLSKDTELHQKRVVCIFPDGIDRYISLL